MPSVQYRNKVYSCEYLDWYVQLTAGNKVSRPNCVIHYEKLFLSNMRNFQYTSGVAGLNLSSSTFGNYTKTIQLELNASIQLDKVMIILPMDYYYASLMHLHASRTIMKTIVIAMLKPHPGKTVVETEFTFWHTQIDHINMAGTRDIILLLSPKSIVIKNYAYDMMNQKQGHRSYELHFDTANFSKGVFGG